VTHRPPWRQFLGDERVSLACQGLVLVPTSGFSGSVEGAGSQSRDQEERLTLCLGTSLGVRGLIVPQAMTIVPALVAHLGIRGVVGHPGRCRSLILRGVGTGTTHRSLAIAQLCRPASQWFLTLDDGPRIGPVILHADDPERLMGGPLRWDIFSLPDGCHVVPTKAQPKMLAQRWPKKRLPPPSSRSSRLRRRKGLALRSRTTARFAAPGPRPRWTPRPGPWWTRRHRRRRPPAKVGGGGTPLPDWGRYDLPMGSPGLGKRR